MGPVHLISNNHIDSVQCCQTVVKPRGITNRPLCLQLPAGLFSAPSFAEGRQINRSKFKQDYKANVIGLHFCHWITAKNVCVINWTNNTAAYWIVNSFFLFIIYAMFAEAWSDVPAAVVITLWSSESCWCLMRASLLGNCLLHSRQASLTQSVILPSFSSFSPPSSSLSVSPL